MVLSIFVSSIILMLPQPLPLPKISKIGTALVAIGISFGILMTSYLMWDKLLILVLQVFKVVISQVFYSIRFVC